MMQTELLPFPMFEIKGKSDNQDPPRPQVPFFSIELFKSLYEALIEHLESPYEVLGLHEIAEMR